MRLLLDTHTLLWWAAAAPELSRDAVTAIRNQRNECYVSLASCWEMAIKVSIGKLGLTIPVERFVTEQCNRDNFRLLPIDFRHVCKVESLPFHHRDPFDRLLIAQSLLEKMTIVSADAALDAYQVKRIW